MAEETEETPATDYKALIRNLRESRDDYFKLKERRVARAKARKEKDAKDKEDTEEADQAGV